ncbi:MAG: T9SS type A sorting domain-containing protein, partial [Ferruginibacter sp.]
TVVTPTTTYTIITQNAGGSEASTISFATGNALPVKWIKVDGRLNSSHNAVLHWEVVEQNIASFQVQKSSNGTNFTLVGTLNSKGNGTNIYTYTDANSDNESTLYRIDEIDNDGNNSYSPIIKLNSTPTSTITIYLNPTRGSITVLVPNSLVGTNAILVDISGRTVSKIKLSSNTNFINLGSIVAGVYILQFADGNAKEFIKQ